MAAAAAPLSIAGAGLSAATSIMKGEGESYADQYQAQRLEKAAEIGRVQAVQTSAQMTQKENQMLGNIDAVRAAAHDDPTSPTGAAIRNTAEDMATTQKTITVDNILEQVQQDESDAAYERTASQYAMTGGILGAGASLLGGLGGAFKGM